MKIRFIQFTHDMKVSGLDIRVHTFINTYGYLMYVTKVTLYPSKSVSSYSVYCQLFIIYSQQLQKPKENNWFFWTKPTLNKSSAIQEQVCL